MFPWSTRCSCVDCVGIPPAYAQFLKSSWYRALDAPTFRAYNESTTPYDSKYCTSHQPTSPQGVGSV